VEILFFEIDVWMYTMAVRERPNIAVYIPEYVAVCRLSTSVRWNFPSMAGFTVLGFPVELCRLWYI